MKTALVHDWLNGMRGGEKCLEVLCELYPQSPIYTLFYEKGKVSGPIAQRPVRSSWLERMPAVYSKYRHYLPLFPAAVESLDLREYDLVVSTSHCVAKGAKKRRGAVHICYCFTPMRYAWGFFEEYFGKRGAFARRVISLLIPRLRAWDLRSSAGVDHFVAISRHVQQRIRSCYNRDSEVIYPPCDTVFYTPDAAVKREDFYLVVSALVPYKKIELALEAFAAEGRRLIVIGDGPERAGLERSASDNIRFLGWQPEEVLRDHFRRAQALIFPGEEDFGIVPVEAQACGCPVVAYGKGGALETVIDGKTGVFFAEPSSASLRDAVARFEGLALDPEDARRNALLFARENFKEQMKKMIERQYAEKAGAAA